MDNTPDSNLQLDLLALLVFHDSEAKHIRRAVDLELFDSKPIHNLVRDVYSFLDTYKAAPKAHFAEILAKYAKEADKDLYQQIGARVARLRTGINPTYILSKLQEFLDVQNIQLTVLKVMDSLEKNDLEEARRLFQSGSRKSVELTDMGVLMSEAEEYIFAPDVRREFTCGVKQLDDRRFTPGRGELMMGLGLSGRLKSWWLIHMGAANVRKGFKVLHISLENRMKPTLTRYTQNLLFMGREGTKQSTVIQLTRVPGSYIVTPVTKTYYGLKSPEIKETVAGKLKNINNLLVKCWPDNVLTCNKLNAYLDMLAVSKDYMPDIVLVDYPDLFHMDAREERRIALNRIYTGLRQIAEERHLAMVVVSQSNREGVNKAILTEAQVSEDYSKYMTADAVISFNMTDEEKRLNLARLYVLKNRDDVDKYCVVINPLVDAGQFAITAVDYDEESYKQLIEEQSAILGAGLPVTPGVEFQ